MRHGGGGNVEYDDSPQLVEASFGDNRVVSVSASSNGSFAVTENGQLYVWGQNDNGNLGLGYNTDNRGYAEVNEPGLTVTVVDSFWQWRYSTAGNRLPFIDCSNEKW